MENSAKASNVIFSLLLSISLMLTGQSAIAASYGTSSSPLKVYNGSKLVGESYGSYVSRTRLSGDTYGTTASGSIRDRSPGNETVYVRLTATITARSSTTRSHTSERYNDSSWTRYPTFSAWHASAVSHVDLNVCEDIRFWFDPCSSTKRVYTK